MVNDGFSKFIFTFFYKKKKRPGTIPERFCFSVVKLAIKWSIKKVTDLIFWTPA